ncbi:MAG: response regulator [Gammaproteobacteria bacterium]|nr:response regulator [Gammaproteobacteria bacterium]
MNVMEAEPGTLLVVDDMPANLSVLLTYLDELNFRVLIAEDGEDALEKAAHTKPDIILLDVLMPRLDGFETCRRLKADPQTSEIPVIFMTALTETVDKVKGFEIGAVDYITKPFQQEEVLARINTHLTLKRQAEQLRDSERILEQRVREKTKELAEAHERLKTLDKAKSDFLRLISHECSTPLHGVLGTAEVLFQDKVTTETKQEFQELFRSSFDKLHQIIEQALLLTKIEASGESMLSFAPVSLELVLGMAVDMADAFARSRRVSLAYEPCSIMPDCNVRSELKLLTKALAALIKTAVKFSKENDEVRLGCMCEKNEICIRIDTSRGNIPEEAIPKFFDVFSIAEPITREDDLGLEPPVAERIIRLSGGSVTVENREPSGILFTIRLIIL